MTELNNLNPLNQNTLLEQTAITTEDLDNPEPSLDQSQSLEYQDLNINNLEANEDSQLSPDTPDNLDQSKNLSRKISSNTKRLAAAAVSSMAFLGGSSAIAQQPRSLAKQTESLRTLANLARPLRFLNQVQNFYSINMNNDRGVSNDGDMNNVEHMKIEPHSFQISGVCDITFSNNNYFNSVRLVQNNLKFEHEITCAYGDTFVENLYTPHREYCPYRNEVICKDMNMVPILKTVASEAEAYVSALKPKLMSRADLGSVALLLVDQYKSKGQTDAHIFFRNQVSSAGGRPVREISIFNNKGKQTANATFYK
jgi:hypothetical protein